jgi:hypothetical protein
MSPASFLTGAFTATPRLVAHRDRHARPRSTVPVHAGSHIGELKVAATPRRGWFLLGPVPIDFGGTSPAKDWFSGGRCAASVIDPPIPRGNFPPPPSRSPSLSGRGQRRVAPGGERIITAGHRPNCSRRWLPARYISHGDLCTCGCVG